MPSNALRRLPGSPWLRRGLLLLLLLPPPPLAAQTWNAHQVLDSLRARFNRVEDYQVDLKVSLDLPGLRMPRKVMTLTFKQPDKTRLGARGFGMVPRRGLMLSPDSLFSMLHGLTVEGDTLLDGHPCLILQGLEQGPGDLTLTAQLFVDKDLWLVRDIRTLMGGNEVFRLHTEYVEAAPGIHLPGETRLRFQLNERFMRGRHSWDSLDPDAPKPVLDEGQDMVGEASISFTNYQVNQGIPDSYFHDEKEPD